jgi:Putative auto-transporter adhesin, head GIN domain
MIWRVLRCLICILTFLQVNSSFAYPSFTTLFGKFDSVLVRGDITVTIHRTSGPSYAVVHGDSADLNGLDFSIEKSWLKVCLGKGYPHFSKVTVDIYVQNLHRLTQRGQARVVANGLYSSGLIVSSIGVAPVYLDGRIDLRGVQARGRAHVEIHGVNTKSMSMEMRDYAYARLQGTIGVCQLNIYDYSWLSMFWVNTNEMHLSLAENTYVQMAGQLLLLDLELFDNAHFYGRYLRVNRSFVRTHDRALAEITTTRAQHTLATGESHIDFYNIPRVKSSLMAGNAAVMDMREWTWRWIYQDSNFLD